MFARELNNVFAQIGFDDAHALPFECVIQFRLFRNHGLAFDDGFGIVFARDFDDDAIQRRGIRSEMHLPARAFDIRGELFQVRVEAAQSVRANQTRAVAHHALFDQGRERGAPQICKASRRTVERRVQNIIAQRVIHAPVKGNIRYSVAHNRNLKPDLFPKFRRDVLFSLANRADASRR